ncbi:LPD11 domain-containing protein, partial [Bacteroides xylanisolvens]
HDSFRENEKPEWLTMEQIKEYSNAMGVTQE